MWKFFLSTLIQVIGDAKSVATFEGRRTTSTLCLRGPKQTESEVLSREQTAWACHSKSILETFLPDPWYPFGSPP